MWRKFPYLIIGWLWYIGTLVPVIGLVQVGKQAMADRYTYLPLIGLFIMIIWSAGELVESRKLRKIGLFFAMAILIPIAVITWQQVRYWKNSSTLFEHALEIRTKFGRGKRPGYQHGNRKSGAFNFVILSF